MLFPTSTMSAQAIVIGQMKCAFISFSSIPTTWHTIHRWTWIPFFFFFQDRSTFGCGFWNGTRYNSARVLCKNGCANSIAEGEKNEKKTSLVLYSIWRVENIRRTNGESRISTLTINSTGILGRKERKCNQILNEKKMHLRTHTTMTKELVWLLRCVSRIHHLLRA